MKNSMKIWTPYHHQEESSSDDDDDEESSPRAVKAKESPLPSIVSSAAATETWDKSPQAPGLHHRATAHLEQSNETDNAAFSSVLSSSSPLPQHHCLHSPYQTPRRTRSSAARTRTARSSLLQQPSHLRIFTYLIASALIFWSLTCLLHAFLPSRRGMSTQMASFLRTTELYNSDSSSSFALSQHGYLIEQSPLQGLKRPENDSLVSPSSTTQRRRESRRDRLQSSGLNHGAHWQPEPPTFDLGLVVKNGDFTTNLEESSSTMVDTAPMEALCGYAAEMASLKFPQLFPADRALGDNSRLFWIGPKWDMLEALLQACPSTQLLQIAHSLPDDPRERLQWLRKYPSLITSSSSTDHHRIQFVETVPLGLQTRETTRNFQLDKATHVIWALDDAPAEPTTTTCLLTQLVQTRQTLLDLQASSISHLTILAGESGKSRQWQEALVRLFSATSPFSVSISWVSDLALLIPALQMQHTQFSNWLKIDAALRREVFPETPLVPLLPNKERLPCASECADPDYCEPTVWDDTIVLTQTVTQDCTVVVYTINGDEAVRDLPAAEQHNEDDGDDIFICNVAFVPQSSKLVQSVIQRVPNTDLVRLGVHPEPGDDAHSIHARKLESLNGKLLYRGWILVWVNTTWTDHSLLSLNPGKFWSIDIRFSLYCDTTVTPSYQDSKFLVYQMQRQAWPARNVKLENARYRLPAEPSRQAAVLLSERLNKDKKKITSLRKAIPVLQSDGGNSMLIANQAALYDQFDIWMNRQRHQRRYYKPDPLAYRYRLKHWANTRWILHNHQLATDETDLRCGWYKEMFYTEGSPSLALAHVLAIQELERRWSFGEPDDHTLQHPLARRMAFKEAVTDDHEWILLPLESNRPFAQVSYQLDSARPAEPVETLASLPDGTPLYARIISDRVLKASRMAFTASTQHHEL